MTYELHNMLSQVKPREKVPGCSFVRIHILVGPRVSHVKVQGKKQQLPKPSLVKHAHQIWNMCLYIFKCWYKGESTFKNCNNSTLLVTWRMGIFLCGRDFVQFACFVDITALNNSEVQIPSYLSMHQDFDQLTWCTHTGHRKLMWTH